MKPLPAQCAVYFSRHLSQFWQQHEIWLPPQCQKSAVLKHSAWTAPPSPLPLPHPTAASPLFSIGCAFALHLGTMHGKFPKHGSIARLSVIAMQHVRQSTLLVMQKKRDQGCIWPAENCGVQHMHRNCRNSYFSYCTFSPLTSRCNTFVISAFSALSQDACCS